MSKRARRKRTCKKARAPVIVRFELPSPLEHVRRMTAAEVAQRRRAYRSRQVQIFCAPSAAPLPRAQSVASLIAAWGAPPS